MPNTRDCSKWYFVEKVENLFDIKYKLRNDNIKIYILMQ